MKIHNLIFLLFFAKNSYSQQIAPNFKVNDIFGNEINSETILMQGKSIFIDFFMNSCGGCQYMVPFVDSVFKYYGCNCNDIFFVGISVASWNTDQNIFNFRINYNVEIPLVSGTNGGADIGQMYEIPYVPYFALINNQGFLNFKKSFFITSTQQLLDTLSQYGFLPTLCKDADFLYVEIFNENKSYYGIIDTANRTVSFDVPTNFNIQDYNIFYIKSPKSNLLIENQLVENDTIEINGIDFDNTFWIVAEDNNIAKQWHLVFNFTNLNEYNNYHINFDTKNKIMYIENYKDIKEIKIYDITGKLIYNTIPSSNFQNFSILHSDVYIINLTTKNNLIINKKITIFN